MLDGSPSRYSLLSSLQGVSLSSLSSLESENPLVPTNMLGETVPHRLAMGLPPSGPVALGPKVMAPARSLRSVAGSGRLGGRGMDSTSRISNSQVRRRDARAATPWLALRAHVLTGTPLGAPRRSCTRRRMWGATRCACPRRTRCSSRTRRRSAR